MLILCAALFAFVLAGQDDKFGNHCQFYAGDSFVGTYGTTARAASQTGKDFRLTIAQNNYATFVSEGVAVFTRFIATDDYVSIADLAAYPEGNKCPTNHLAKYEATWSADCMTLELRQRIDPCGRRGGLLRGASGEPLVLQKEACTTSVACEATYEHSLVYTGKFHEHAEGHVTMTLAHGAVTVETSEMYGTLFIVLDASPTGNALATVVGGQYNPEGSVCEFPYTIEVASVDSAQGGACVASQLSVVDASQCAAGLRYEGLTLRIDRNMCNRATPTEAPAPPPAPAPKPHEVLDVDRHFYYKPLKYVDAGLATDHKPGYDHTGHRLDKEARKEAKGAHVHHPHESESSTSSSSSDTEAY